MHIVDARFGRIRPSIEQHDQKAAKRRFSALARLGFRTQPRRGALIADRSVGQMAPLPPRHDRPTYPFDFDTRLRHELLRPRSLAVRFRNSSCRVHPTRSSTATPPGITPSTTTGTTLAVFFSTTAAVAFGDALDRPPAYCILARRPRPRWRCKVTSNCTILLPPVHWHLAAYPHPQQFLLFPAPRRHTTVAARFRGPRTHPPSSGIDEPTGADG
jgi:hypothetical protein